MRAKLSVTIDRAQKKTCDAPGVEMSTTYAAMLVLAAGAMALSSCVALLLLNEVAKHKQQQQQQGGAAAPGGGGGAPPASVGAVPPNWQKVDILITGNTIGSNSGYHCGAVSLNAMQAECHANASCTHVEVWPGYGKYFLKNANDLPRECLYVTAQCSDGDQSANGGVYGYYHPLRGWGQKAANVKNMIKEIECSSGSQCDLSQIFSMIGLITLPLSFVPFGDILSGVGAGIEVASTAVNTALRIAGVSVSLGINIGIPAAEIVSKLIEAKKNAQIPFSNQPGITPWEYQVATEQGQPTMLPTVGVTWLGQLEDMVPSANRKNAIANAVTHYQTWMNSYAAWLKLPQSYGNFMPPGINWAQFYNNQGAATPP